MLNKIIAYLNRPFYDTCSIRKNIGIFILVSLFVSAFLWFFEPFDFGSYSGNKLTLALTFGLITFVTGMAVEIFQLRVLKIDKEHPDWTFGKWLIGTTILILCISISNYLFINYLNDWGAWSFNLFGRFVINTLAIGIFPIFIIGALSLRRHQREFSAVADSLSGFGHHTVDITELVIPSQTNEDLVLQASAIYYLEAQQNYVAVIYEKFGIPEEKLIRNTLKSITEILPGDSFFQSHRSFVVNLDKVSAVSGNSQGLVLSLPNGKTVPVSRSYISSFREKWS
jgi:hypothetical protein